MNWKDYWVTYPRKFARTDYLRQVKNTVGGQPVTALEIEASIVDICDRLDIKPDDILLDLCCGNGLITKELAGRCHRVVGVDFSQPLIEIANSDHRPSNVTYFRMDVLDVGDLRKFVAEPFTKVAMVRGLQYFDKRDLVTLLRNITSLLSDSGIILLAEVPDRDRKGVFYNTMRRRLRGTWERMTGRDQLGTWWDAPSIERTCDSLGLECHFFHSDSRTGYPYRFDVKITRKVRQANRGS